MEPLYSINLVMEVNHGCWSIYYRTAQPLDKVTVALNTFKEIDGISSQGSSFDAIAPEIFKFDAETHVIKICLLPQH